MDKATVKIDLLFETSWEVCNKIGGIYTVLSTKAKTLQKENKDKTIFIGPDVWSEENPSPFFVESRTLLKDWKAQAKLPEGLTVRVGRWDIPGKPIVVLVKFDAMYAVKDEFYGLMWNLYGVDSLHAYGDYDEACTFSHAAGIVIESICNYHDIAGKNVVAHFDEWTTGMGLLYVKHVLPQVATIFTTHATSIGRSICGNNKPLYDYLKGYNGDQMAGELNMQSKHSLEKAAAWAADCFTTVSEITAVECEQLLDKRPHVVTPNGFEQNFVPAKGKYADARKFAREKLLNVASSLTGGKYEDDKTFIVATSGRCEYRNKGIDLFLDSMTRLADKSLSKNILAFVMVPAWVKEPRADLAKAVGMKRKSRLDDPVITHWLNNMDCDPIINRIHGIGFVNDKQSKVTVIYVPCYLNGDDGIFNASYYDLVIGMNATVFPSYYEPWGYTPLESVAFGVPTITTSLSGFGQWIIATYNNDFVECGVNVIDRGDYNYDVVADKIADALHGLAGNDDLVASQISKSAMATAAAAAWSNFIIYYHDAFKVAIENAHNRNK
ncbi:MAG: glycogen/starch synthase [Muribaculaceae bacterium]|nr:glycogen/starch synthase [Muribaculaceae bacterium]